MLRYYSDILFEYKDCSVEQYVIYIGKKRCNMQDEIKRDKISFNYDIIDVKDIACEDLLYHTNPSAVALSILCDFKEKDKQTVVNTILKRIKELTKDDEVEYRNFIKKINILSTNRNLEKEVEKGMRMLTVDIEKTPLYQWEMKQTQFRSAMIMIKEFKIAIDDVVQKLNIKKEELLEYMKNKEETK